MIHLAIDLLGADTDETELCRGALSALAQREDIFLHLFGHAEKLTPLLGAYCTRAEVIDCPETVTNYDNSMTAYEDENASVVRAMRFAAGREDVYGVITCGSTGAVLVCAIMILGKKRGMRPALGAVLPDKDCKPFLLLDCGANIDCRAELYVTFARMADEYLRRLGIENPRIALLSNGAEDTKGCQTVKEANALLRASGLHFVGNMEPTHVMDGVADAIVCDGFHGNILLKSIEGTAKAVLSELYRTAPADARPALDAVLYKYDHNSQGGAVLLGVNKLVMKGHGAATGEGVKKMVLDAAKVAQGDGALHIGCAGEQ